MSHGPQRIPDAIFQQTLVGFLKPIEKFLADDRVSEVMINGAREIYIERGGKLELSGAEFPSDHALETAVRNIAQFVGKTSASPLKVNGDIRNISGATLSSMHVTEGVKRILAAYGHR